MTEDFNFTIPSTLRDIRLSQWQSYVEVMEKNKDAELTDFIEKKLLSIFCNVELRDIDRIGLNVFNNTLEHLSKVLNSEAELVKTFKLKGTDGVIVEFGLIPNFDKMSYGEFIDLERYLFDNRNLHRAMAVMYRPVKSKSSGTYTIHKYKGTELMAEVMKNTPLDVALGARVFFYRLASKLGNFTLVSTLKELQSQQEGLTDSRSVKNGETIKQYLLSLEKMSEELELLQSSHFINA